MSPARPDSGRARLCNSSAAIALDRHGAVCAAALAGRSPQPVAARNAHDHLLSGNSVQASSAAFSITARGAVSPVQISNCRTACSMNICMPGMTVLPCSRARRISAVSSGL